MGLFILASSPDVHSQSYWDLTGNQGTTNPKLGITDYEDLHLYTNDVIRLSITKDGDLGLGLVQPNAKQEILFCPANGQKEMGLIVTRDECPGSNVAQFNPTLPDFIGGFGAASSGGGEGGTFTLPFSFLTGHTTNVLNPHYSSDKPIFWLRSSKLAGTIGNTSGVDEYDSKFIVMPDGSTGINVAHPRAALDVRGSQAVNRPAAIFGSRAIGTGSTNSSNLFQYYTQQLHIVPVLGDKGYNGISKANDQGLFFSDGKGSEGSNLDGNLIIAPWTTSAASGSIGGLKIYSNGNIGAFGNLDVYGDIKSHKLTVKSFGWPDYVFEPSYDLMNLDEIRSFIKSHGHLPNVPSESEVQTDGVDVAEMQELLLRKIEELTLYILQQDDKCKAMQNQIDGLK